MVVVALVAGAAVLFGGGGDSANDDAAAAATSPAIVGGTPVSESASQATPVATATSEPTADATAVPEATATPIIIATIVPPPTATPTQVIQPVVPPDEVRIRAITIQGSSYAVAFVTGFTAQLPGQHVHFFYNTVPATDAGSPGGGPWELYAGPSPFTGYSVASRPGGATMLCALVANNNHSVNQGTGNCVALP